ncbi:major strawberry allergen Fra a 1.08-like [Aristolochia californica]|uniref:major strawberry allergen Fra a 1.08-like n=1 Tax=Aristolochia californica TaxID=171875 RepID=UPI0035E059CD
MVAGTYTHASVSPVPVSRLWKASADTDKIVPKILPEIIASIVVLEGDGGVGTVKQINFTKAMKECSYVKERVDAVDPEKRVYKSTVLEGGLIGLKFKSYAFEAKMEATSEGGAKTTLTLEYDTIGETPLSQEELEKIVGGMMSIPKAIETHLLANPDAYV